MNAALTPGQRALVQDLCASGRGVELVLGVAGSGKTTALAALGDAYTAAGFTVIGTSTSGQAARTLQQAADIPSRTLASLLWRIDHHQLTLDNRTVVVLDEAGMTDDPDLHRLLVAADNAHAKVVMVGDDRQLSAVGPGGGLGALIDRWHPAVHRLVENIRQHDPDERVALAQLRHGDVEEAVGWMAATGRIVTAPTRPDTLQVMVDRWFTDVTQQRETVMLAYKRVDVEQLNWLAHFRMREAGRLAGPILGVDDGLDYQAGDRVVALAPGADRKYVTSERGTITHIDPQERALWVRFDDGHLACLDGHELQPDRLAHGYAITVHRAQGATVDAAHVLEDGGGRELAYVKTSRAREHTVTYVTADDLDQAVEDLTRDWAHQQRQQWVIDTHHPGVELDDTRRHEPTPLEAAARRLQLAAEQWAVNALLPPDVEHELHAARQNVEHVELQLEYLRTGHYSVPAEIRRAAIELESARHDVQYARNTLHSPFGGRRGTRERHRKLEPAERHLGMVEQHWNRVAGPTEQPLIAELEQAAARVDELNTKQQQRLEWLQHHPEAAQRLEHLDRALTPTIQRPIAVNQNLEPKRPRPERGLGLGR